MTRKLVPPKSKDRNFPRSLPFGRDLTYVGKHLTLDSK